MRWKNVGAVVALAAAVTVGCSMAGGKGAASSPKDVGEKMISAMQSSDWAGLYDLLGGEAKTQVDTEIDKLTASATTENREQAKKMMGFDPAELKGMPKREAFAKMTEGMMKFMVTMAKSMGAKEMPDISAAFAKTKVVDSKTEGDKGSVTIQDDKGKKTVLKVEKTPEGWKLVTPPKMK